MLDHCAVMLLQLHCIVLLLCTCKRHKQVKENSVMHDAEALMYIWVVSKRS